MSTVSNKIIQAAAGNNNNIGPVGGEFIEVAGAGTGAGSVYLSSAPQAGDLLIAGNGFYAGYISTPPGFTPVINHLSPNWSAASPSYYESSYISYKIATGTEGTIINGGGGSRSVAVYRFNYPVTSVSIQSTHTQSSNVNRTQTVSMQSSHTFPNIYVCSVGAYDQTALSMTNQDFSNKYTYVYMAASLRDTAAETLITGSGGIKEACVYAVLAPNFD